MLHFSTQQKYEYEYITIFQTKSKKQIFQISTTVMFMKICLCKFWIFIYMVIHVWHETTKSVNLTIVHFFLLVTVSGLGDLFNTHLSNSDPYMLYLLQGSDG